MIVIVTIRPCPAETGGGMWGVGETHSVSDSYAKALIGRGDAYAPGGEIVDIGGGVVGDGLTPGSYGDIIAVGNPTTGLNISSSVLTAAARTVVDDTTVADMVNTLGGASSTGSGGLVRATSPTLATPILGTPQSVNLSNGTSLPVSTGISGLATGVAAFLATPSSANLATAVTDDTGTGALVFANSPTLVAPALGTPASGTLSNCTGLPAAGVTGLTTVATDVIFDAAGDLVVGTGSNTSARLAIGATGNILRSNGTTAAWASLAAADIAIADAGSLLDATTVEAALQELAGRPFGSSGGDDVTGWGSFTGNPGTVTINGVTQTIGRDGSGNIISYTIALSTAADIVTTISYDNGYAEASGNIIRGGAISMTAAQAAALKSEILDSLGAAANGFKARVTDLFYRTTTAASTPIYHDGVMEWQNTRFRPVSGCAFDVWHNATHVNSSAESADLATVVLPRWLNKAGAQWRTTNLLSSAGGTAGTLATATKINGTTRGGGTSGSAVAATNCNILDIRCSGDAAQLFLPNGGSMISGTAVTGAALVETAIDSASTDITVTVTGTVNQVDKTITHRLTRVELLA